LEAEWEKLKALRAELEREKEEFAKEREASGVEYKLFAGNLGLEATKESIHKLFQTYGPIKDIVILKDPEGKSKRSCFVKFYTKGSADAAIASLHDRVNDQGSTKPLAVRYAERKPKERASVFNTPFITTPFPTSMSTSSTPTNPTHSSHSHHPYHQHTHFSSSPSSGGGVSLSVVPPPSPSNPYFSYPSDSGSGAFGTPGSSAFGTPGSSIYGLTPTHSPHSYQPPSNSYPTTPFSGGGFGSGRSARGPAGSNLYVCNLGSASESDIRTIFGDYGNILSISIFPQGYGFVSYDNSQSAYNAIHHLNGMVSMDGTKKLEVSLKKDK